MVAKHKEPIEAEIVEEKSPSDVAQAEVVSQQDEIECVEATNPLAPLGEFIVGARVFGAALTQAIREAQGRLSPAVRSMIAPAQDARTPLNVPATLWAGKTPEMARDGLQDDYGPEVIAVILDKLSDNKTENGRLLSQEEMDKGVVRDPVTYQRKFERLLIQANTRYLFTFNG